MSKYKFSIEGSVKPTEWGGKIYDAGDEFETDDACTVLAFSAAFKAENPK